MIVSFLIKSVWEFILFVCGISFIAVVLKCTIVVRKHFGIKFIECVLLQSLLKLQKKWRKMQKIFKKQHSDSSPTPLQEQPAGWQLPLRQSVGEIRQQRASSIKLGLFDSSFCAVDKWPTWNSSTSWPPWPWEYVSKVAKSGFDAKFSFFAPRCNLLRQRCIMQLVPGNIPILKKLNFVQQKISSKRRNLICYDLFCYEEFQVSQP